MQLVQVQSSDIDLIAEVKDEITAGEEKPDFQDDKPASKPDVEIEGGVYDKNVVDEPGPSQTVDFDPWKDF